MAESTSKASKTTRRQSSNPSRKTRFKVYADHNRRERNKERKIRRHLRRHPQDQQAAEALERVWQ